MWQPTTWAEVEAAFGVSKEGQSLDFKNAPSLNNAAELAKDVAAMSIIGGVLAYGIDEVDEVAVSAPGVPIAGQQNRIHQILDSRLTPPIIVEVRTVDDPSRQGIGVVLVMVPPSVNAPHYWQERFPARSGTTSRNLTEPEIADLYGRRAAITSAQVDASPILEGHVGPEWFHLPRLDMTGVGVMLVTVTPLARSRLEYRLGTRLSEAARDADRQMSTLVRPQPAIPSAFFTWNPLEARGWTSGRGDLPEGFLRRSPTYAATLLYATGFSFHLTCPVDVEGAKYVNEYFWASNLVGVLAFAASFFQGDPAAALVRVDLGLSGLDGAKPGPNQHWLSGEALKIPEYFDRQVLAVVDLGESPKAGAASLLDRFLVSIRPDGPDLLGLLA